ncbi:MAG: hypothetical protein K2G40_07715 [Muribaculaceae bacterium]|nr:hypothetical protein [Muribaculaceae bacterium]
MRANFNMSLTVRGLKVFYIVLLLLFTGIQSMNASIGDAQGPETSDEIPAWPVVVMASDLMAEVEAVGGEWIPAQYLSSSGKSDFDYSGFLLRPANAAIVVREDVLKKFIKDNDEIYNRANYEKITPNEFRAMPQNKILSIMIIKADDGKRSIRVNLNNEGYKQNPLTAIAVDLSLASRVHLLNICDEPIQGK